MTNLKKNTMSTKTNKLVYIYSVKYISLGKEYVTKNCGN